MPRPGRSTPSHLECGGDAGRVSTVTGADAALLALAGFLAGAINALAGGGSLVSFPALVASGLPPLAANVTNTVAVWPGYLGSTVAYRSQLAGQGRRLAALGGVAAAGAVAGSYTLLVAPPTVFEAVVPVLIVVGAVLLLAQPRIASIVQKRLDDGGATTVHAISLHGAVFVAGGYGAYFGGGLGVILLAVLGIFVAEHLQRINGLKTALSALINTVALAAFALFGPVDWPSVLVVGPAALAGGYSGGRLARVLSPTVLRYVVAVFAVVVATWLALR